MKIIWIILKCGFFFFCFGCWEFNNYKESIIYGLFIINSKSINSFIINRFIEYNFDSLINMINSINQKKLYNKNNCEIIIDKIFNELIMNKTYQINDDSKISYILFDLLLFT